jgi:hypothetical protein
MKIWELDSDRNGGYETIVMANRKVDFPKYIKGQFNGNPIEYWGDIKFLTHHKGKPSDIPDFSSGKPVFSRKALDALEGLLDGSAQILPIIHDQHELYMINVLQVLDAIDYEHSIIDRFENGTFRNIIDYAFWENKLIGQHIFKLPELRLIRVFVSDLFRERCLSAGLHGFKFIEVWDSENSRSTESTPAAVRGIEDNAVSSMPYADAVQLLLNGKAIASGKWKLQKDNTGNILLGELLEEDGEYNWIDPVYYPPIFHELKWQKVESSVLSQK